MNLIWVISGLIISLLGFLITGLGWNWDKWHKYSGRESEVSSIKKIDQSQPYKTLTIVKGYAGIMNFVKGDIFLFATRFRWADDEALILIKLPQESEERTYNITDKTPLPFIIRITSKGIMSLITVEKKYEDKLQIRTYTE